MVMTDPHGGRTTPSSAAPATPGSTEYHPLSAPEPPAAAPEPRGAPNGFGASLRTRKREKHFANCGGLSAVGKRHRVQKGAKWQK